MAMIPADVLHDVLVYFNDYQLFELQFVCRRFRAVCSTKLAQSPAKSQRPSLLAMTPWTLALVFVLLMVLVFPFASLEAAKALPIRQEASRPIEHGFTAEVSVSSTCKIRCADRVADKCHFECDFKDGKQKLTRTSVDCDDDTHTCNYQVQADWDRIFERYPPRTRTQMNCWKDYTALLILWTPMLCLPSMALLVDYLWQSRIISRSAHLFVANNALRKLQEKRRALVRHLSLFMSFDVGLFACVGIVLCIGIYIDSSAEGLFQAGMFLFSFLHLFAAFAYIVFVFHDPFYGKLYTLGLGAVVLVLCFLGAFEVTLMSLAVFTTQCS